MTAAIQFHESKCVTLHSEVTHTTQELVVHFEALGFTFYDDVASLDRTDRVKPWEHSSIVEAEVQYQGEEVFGFDDEKWDVLILEYMFATLPLELLPCFVNTVFALSERLSLQALYDGTRTNPDELRHKLLLDRDKLLHDTGLSVGSEDLAIAIARSYPRWQ